MERSPSQATTHETPAVDKHTITDLSPLTWRGICDASLTIVIQDAEKKVWAMRQFRAIRWCTHLTAHSKSGESGVKQATKKKKTYTQTPNFKPPLVPFFLEYPHNRIVVLRDYCRHVSSAKSHTGVMVASRLGSAIQILSSNEWTLIAT